MRDKIIEKNKFTYAHGNTLLHCVTVPIDVVVVENRFDDVCETDIEIVVVKALVVVKGTALAVVVVVVPAEAHGTLQLRGHDAIVLGLEQVKTIHSGAS